jgi:glycerophosphoryl diester phosphodiesterase
MLPELIAHRGMPQLARENTLRSFELALQAGADAIELDVHVSADAAVVVHHDPWIAPAASREIARLELPELARYEIPTLDAVCELVGDRAALYVEAKAPRSAAAIVECLTAHRVRAAVHSFDPAVIRAVRAMAPGLPVGLLLSDRHAEPAELVRGHVLRDLWPAHEIIDARLVASVHDLGARVIAWTVNSANDARRLHEMGVDALCTDDVTTIRAALAGRG